MKYLKGILEATKALLTFEKGYIIFPRWGEIAYSILFYCILILFICSLTNIIC